MPPEKRTCFQETHGGKTPPAGRVLAVSKLFNSGPAFTHVHELSEIIELCSNRDNRRLFFCFAEERFALMEQSILYCCRWKTGERTQLINMIKSGGAYKLFVLGSLNMAVLKY